MKRRTFLKGLLGVAAIPYIGLPTPKPVSLAEAALATQKKLVDGIVEQITSVNKMGGLWYTEETPWAICPPYASRSAVISDTAAADAGYCRLLRASLDT